MDNPFSYPSLAFGAEAMQLGDSLKRYQSFRNESEPLETDGEREQPIPPAKVPDDAPPAGGLESAKEIPIINYVLYGAILSLGIYLASNYSDGQFDISMPTF